MLTRAGSELRARLLSSVLSKCCTSQCHVCALRSERAEHVSLRPTHPSEHVGLQADVFWDEVVARHLHGHAQGAAALRHAPGRPDQPCEHSPALVADSWHLHASRQAAAPLACMCDGGLHVQVLHGGVLQPWQRSDSVKMPAGTCTVLAACQDLRSRPCSVCLCEAARNHL